MGCQNVSCSLQSDWHLGEDVLQGALDRQGEASTAEAACESLRLAAALMELYVLQREWSKALTIGGSTLAATESMRTSHSEVASAWAGAARQWSISSLAQVTIGFLLPPVNHARCTRSTAGNAHGHDV
jgi:hypothetical protein